MSAVSSFARVAIAVFAVVFGAALAPLAFLLGLIVLAFRMAVGAIDWPDLHGNFNGDKEAYERARWRSE